ncbi:TPA: hypothetical protein DEG21_05105 [Patescibacteria group bacterium]|nr:hypothetical protein [Candidatus Gracilibacteria bacterium]HBY75208.1 hypothetical protein [Candidatus Gracilibacteria bacterium]
MQSERLDIYKKYIDKLIEEGAAYYCFCSTERLTEVRLQQTELKLPTKYDEFCRNIPLEDAKIRVKN